MFFKLFLLFTIIPAAELALLIYIGTRIGTLNTIAIIVLTALVGASLVRMEGLGVMYRMRRDLEEGAFPADEILNGVLVLVGGALLLTPGFMTDLMGFAAVVPATRQVMKRILRRWVDEKIRAGHIRVR